jgi:predicted nuclease of restriction endonuclease-like (RecB) superfamily
MTAKPISRTADYGQWLTALKDLIRQSRVQAALAVNRELVLLYWRLGQEILQRQEQQGWGAKVVAQLAQDLRGEFPDMRGLSRTNLLYMRAFADAWPEESFVQQLAGQIPWFHNCLILDRLKDQKLRVWYIQKTIDSGWSRAALEYQIDTQLHLRLGLAQNNFSRTLPAPQSELARDLAKDSYAFDFLGLTDQLNERSIEKALTMHLRDFLVELGVGFAFVGSQYKLEIEGDEFYIDLLFYHTRLHCYVVLELKNTEFKFEYTGQLNGYLAAVDDLVRDAAVDAPTIGMILCKSKKKTMVEYALRGMDTPMGVSTFRTALPPEVLSALPSIETLTAKLDGWESDEVSHD